MSVSCLQLLTFQICFPFNIPKCCWALAPGSRLRDSNKTTSLQLAAKCCSRLIGSRYLPLCLLRCERSIFRATLNSVPDIQKTQPEALTMNCSVTSAQRNTSRPLLPFTLDPVCLCLLRIWRWKDDAHGVLFCHKISELEIKSVQSICWYLSKRHLLFVCESSDSSPAVLVFSAVFILSALCHFSCFAKQVSLHSFPVPDSPAPPLLLPLPSFPLRFITWL